MILNKHDNLLQMSGKILHLFSHVSCYMCKCFFYATCEKTRGPVKENRSVKNPSLAKRGRRAVMNTLLLDKNVELLVCGDIPFTVIVSNGGNSRKKIPGYFSYTCHSSNFAGHQIRSPQNLPNIKEFPAHLQRRKREASRYTETASSRNAPRNFAVRIRSRWFSSASWWIRSG